MGQFIPAPLRQLMTERESLRVQMEKLQNDYDMLQNEKQKAIEDFETHLAELLQRREKLKVEHQQFVNAVETMKQAFQIPDEEQTPPEETPQ